MKWKPSSVTEGEDDEDTSISLMAGIPYLQCIMGITSEKHENT